MKSKQFEVGKTYYSETRSGNIRLFEVVNVLRRKSTKERVYVEARYDGGEVKRYPIKTLRDGWEVIDIDKRFCTVIDTTEYKRG